MDSDGDALRDGVIARELEFAWMRGIGLVVLALGIAAACRFGRQSLWVYGLAALYQGVTVLVTYPFALGYARRSVQALCEDPAGFAATHRYPRLGAPGPPLLDEPGLWLSLPLVIAMGGPVAASVWVDRVGAEAYRDLGLGLFALLLTAAVNMLTESYVWATEGRALLLSTVAMDSPQAMADAGYRWAMVWGWRRCRRG